MRGATTTIAALANIAAFQSTLLMRGATSSSANWSFSAVNFNPRSSCEERRKYVSSNSSSTAFQSTLLMRGATYTDRTIKNSIGFQSTLLMRGATYDADRPTFVTLFQSTLLMRGATADALLYAIEIYNFNPRSSCEERRAIDCNVCNDITIFQSTLLMRGATEYYGNDYTTTTFQSTLLMRGATR